VLNAQEAAAITAETSLEAALERLCAMTAGAVVLTIGGAGALLAIGAGKARGVAAPIANVVDTSGAGDALFGTLLALWADGEGLEAALAAAVRVAARAVERPGALAGLPSTAEMSALIRERNPS